MAAPREHVAAAAAASSAGTASTAARPTSSCPTLFQDNHVGAAAAHARRRLPPQRGPRRPRDRVPRRPARRSSRDQPFFLYFATGACHSPHHAPPEWIERYRGQFDDGLGRVARARRSPASRRSGLLPAGHRSCRPARRGCPRGTTSSPRTSRSRRGSWSASPRFLSHADAQIGRVLDVHRGARRARQHARRARVRQRRERRGRRARLDQRRPPLERHPGRAHASCAPASTSSADRPRTTTTRGAGRWPATRRSGAGSARCTRAASPTRASCTGRDGVAGRGEIRHQFAHAIDVLPTILELIGIDAARRDRRRRAAPDRGHELRLPARRRADAPERHDHAVLRDARQPRRSTTTGWKAVTFKPLGRDVRRRPRPRRAVRRRRVGAVPRGRGPLGVRRPRRRRSPTSSPSWSTCGGRRRARYQVLPLDNRPLAVMLPRDRAGTSSASRYVYLAGRRAGARDRDRERPEPHAPDHRRRRGRRGRDPAKACCSRWARVLGGWSFHVDDGRLRYVHNLYGKERYTVVVRHGHRAPVRTRSRSSSPRPTSTPGTGHAVVDGAVVGEGEIPHVTPARYSAPAAGLTLRLGAGPADRRRLRRAVPVHRRLVAPRGCRRERLRDRRPANAVRRDHGGAVIRRGLSRWGRTARRGSARRARRGRRADRSRRRRTPAEPQTYAVASGSSAGGEVVRRQPARRTRADAGGASRV